jgi:hypothetical protein
MKLMRIVFSMSYQIVDILKMLAELSSIGTIVNSFNRVCLPTGHPLVSKGSVFAIN